MFISDTYKYVIPHWCSATCMKSQPQKIFILLLFFFLAFMLHQETVFRGAIWVLMLCFGKHYSAVAIPFGAFSCWTLVLYIRGDGKGPSVVFFALRVTPVALAVLSSKRITKEPDFIGSSLKYSCRRHARNWNEEYSVPRSESAEPLYPFLPGRGAAWPCFQTTLLLNVTLL